MEKVYILESAGLYKIGFTAGSVKDRIKSMKTGNPMPIDIVREYDVEKGKVEELKLHKKFISKRIKGEWFKLSFKDIEKIDKYFNIEFENEYVYLFKDNEIKGSNFFKQCVDTGIESFNICIGVNIFPLNYLKDITDYSYADIKLKLYNDTHKGLIEIINKQVLYNVFKVGHKKYIMHPKEIEDILDNSLLGVEFIRNGLILVLGENYRIPITININPKYS